jgi:hypothetical protein
MTAHQRYILALTAAAAADDPDGCASAYQVACMEADTSLRRIATINQTLSRLAQAAYVEQGGWTPAHSPRWRLTEAGREVERP